MYLGKPGEPGDSEVQEEEMPRVPSVPSATRGFPEPDWDLLGYVIPGFE